MPQWDSDQYLKFLKQRTQPSIDLANRIDIENPAKILDIGCGPGNSTNVLKNKFPNSYVLGVDNSKNMLEKAKNTYKNINFKYFDAINDDYNSLGKYDIVFSNACIQWLPNHNILLKKFMSLLNKGGVMAAQEPITTSEPIYKIIQETANNEYFKSKIKNPRVFYTLTAGEYFDILSDISSDFEIWQTDYMHRMKTHQDIIELFKGTGLRPYIQSLDGENSKKFLNEVYKKVVKAYPKQKNGEIIFTFQRLFFISKN